MLCICEESNGASVLLKSESIGDPPSQFRPKDGGHGHSSRHHNFDSFSDREVGADDVCRVDEEDISDVHVIGGNINGAEMLIVSVLMLEYKGGGDEAKRVFSDAWVPNNGHFLKSVHVLIWGYGIADLFRGRVDVLDERHALYEPFSEPENGRAHIRRNKHSHPKNEQKRRNKAQPEYVNSKHLVIYWREEPINKSEKPPRQIEGDGNREQNSAS